ncbi:hypothetical protein MTO96_019012 [Rhipicephalus appendiculatus]
MMAALHGTSDVTPRVAQMKKELLFAADKNTRKRFRTSCPARAPHQGVPCDLSAANGAAYSDILLNHHHPTRLPAHLVHGTDTHTLTPIELLDVKYGSYGAPHLAPLTQTNYTFRPASLRPQDHPAQHRTPQHATLHGHHAGSAGSGGGRRSAPGTSQRSSHKAPSNSRTASSRRSHRGGEQFNPIYEEVSGRSKSRRGYRHHDSEDSEEDEARSLGSEDEFAEDELSLGRVPEARRVGQQQPAGLHGRRPVPAGRRAEAKHNYYLSKSALAFDQRNPGPYSSVDLMQHPHPDSNSPPEPAPGAVNFGAASQAGFMMGPDCQYPPATNAPFSTFLLQPCGAVQEDNAAEGDAENIYASIDDDEVPAGPYTIGGGGTRVAAAKPGQGARTVAKEASVVPSYGDIRPVFPADQSGRTLCT